MTLSLPEDELENIEIEDEGNEELVGHVAHSVPLSSGVRVKRVQTDASVKGHHVREGWAKQRGKTGTISKEL